MNDLYGKSSFSYLHGFDTEYMSELSDACELATSMRKHGSLEFTVPYSLVLLSMCKDGYFTTLPSIATTDVRQLLREQQMLPNYDLYYEILMGLVPIAVYEKVFVLQSNDLALLLPLRTESYLQNFAVIFDYVLDGYITRSSGFGGSSYLPAELPAFTAGLLNLAPGAKVFNPFAGLASFGLALKDDIQYLGQEIYRSTYNLARLRALAHGRTEENGFELRNDDSIMNWPSEEQFDLVIASPPFNMNLSRYSKEVAKMGVAGNFMILEGLKVLEPYGTLITIVPLGFLQGRGRKEKAIRERLVKEGLLEKVITFPEGLLNNTYIPFAMLIIRAEGSSLLAPMLIDTSAFTERSGREVKFKPQELLELLSDFGDKRTTVARASIATVSASEIAANDYVLNPTRYLLPDYDGVELGKLLKPVAGKRVPDMMQGYLTTVKDLRDEQSQEYRIQSEKPRVYIQGENELPRSTKQILDPVLLVAMVGKKLKPSYFEGTAGKLMPLYTAPQVKAFTVDQSKVDISYMINELRSPQVQEQLEAYRTGSGIPRLYVEDLMRVRIPLPTLIEQRQKAKVLKEVSQQIAELRQEKTEITEGGRIERRRRFASLKHTMGRPQQSILSAAMVIKGYIEQLGLEGEAIDRAYAAYYEQDRTISDTLQGIIQDVDFISRLMDEGENGLRVEDYKLSFVSLKDLLKELRRINVQDCKFNLKIDTDKGDEDWSRLHVRVNLDLFRIMVENIITNADKHGFDEYSADNLVWINVTAVTSHLLLEIRNNGKPFPHNFGQEQFIQEFSRTQETRGEGIGGYQIDQIGKYFDSPDWALSSAPQEAFPVAFTFKMPLAETIEVLDL